MPRGRKPSVNPDTVQTPNDQGELIQALKDKQYYKAWSIVKHIGYKTQSNEMVRYVIFMNAASKFDPWINNNFIQYYKKYLSTDTSSMNRKAQAKYTNNVSINNDMISEAIIPRDPDLEEKIPVIFTDLRHFY